MNIQGLSYETTEKQTIELVKGDDFMKELGVSEIDLLKIDVEVVLGKKGKSKPFSLNMIISILPLRNYF